MILKLPKLETERLVLRPFTLEDATLVQKYAGDKRIYQTTSNIPHPYENGMAEWWISTHATTFFEKKGVVLAITLKENGELIGAIGLHADTENKRAELGYWIAPEYWGKGFCTESAGVLIKYGVNGKLKSQ
jgi:RimJ/RimL family protein N-acetyltransferase